MCSFRGMRDRCLGRGGMSGKRKEGSVQRKTNNVKKKTCKPKNMSVIYLKSY